jgi:hypothetical protein
MPATDRLFLETSAFRQVMTGVNELGARKFIVQLLAIAALMVAARFGFEFLLTLGFVYRDSIFDQAVLAFGILLMPMLFVVIFAIIRLAEKKFVLGFLSLVMVCIPFVIPPVLDPAYWKFRANRSSYVLAVKADPSPQPKYLVFSWGNYNTTFGGGVVFQAIVYDESDEISLAPDARSAGWITRRSNWPPEDRWIYVLPGKYSYTCKRRTVPFSGHFFYVEEQC